jgi:serine/threonine protein kinase
MKDNNVIHRDLKTENILLTKDKNIKISDFGLARLLTSLSEMASTECGTPTTIAPEILEGKKYTYSADIWSLGCVFYELWVGVSPF